jgi:hypothetical protein
MGEKIKILFLAANPTDTVTRLQLDREVSEITEKIRSSSHGDSIEFISEWSIKPGVLQGLLFRHKPHILHFSGHGSKEKGIVLEDDSGNSVAVSKPVFTRLMKLAKGNIRIVVLNACYTKEQAEFLKDTIDFTIGMNRPIGDKAAGTFAAYFYQALAFGLSVPDAFESALIQMDMNGTSQADIPELHIRRGIDPSQPFLSGGDTEEEEDSFPDDLAYTGNGVGVNNGIINNAKKLRVKGGQIGQKNKNYYSSRPNRKR